MNGIQGVEDKDSFAIAKATGLFRLLLCFFPHVSRIHRENIRIGNWLYIGYTDPAFLTTHPLSNIRG